MRNRFPKSDFENRLTVIVAMVIIMSVIVGLWVVLLPSQFDLMDHQLKPSPLWEKLKTNGQETISNWNQTSDIINDSINNTIEAREAEIRATQVQEVITENQEDINQFREKLEQTAIE